MRYDVPLDNYDDGAGRAHLIRYYVARGIVEPLDEVIDVACGTGYGSELISRVATKVYSYDQLDKIRYHGEIDNIEYQKVDLETFDNYPEVDVSISLETIEHLNNPRAMIQNVLKKTKRLFIFSVPLDEEPGANPFHLQTFNKNSIWEIVMMPGWKQFHTLMQGNHLIGIIWKQ